MGSQRSERVLHSRQQATTNKVVGSSDSRLLKFVVSYIPRHQKKASTSCWSYCTNSLLIELQYLTSEAERTLVQLAAVALGYHMIATPSDERTYRPTGPELVDHISGFMVSKFA